MNGANMTGTHILGTMEGAGSLFVASGHNTFLSQSGHTKMDMLLTLQLRE